MKILLVARSLILGRVSAQFLFSGRNVIFVDGSMTREEYKRRTEYVVPDRNTEF